MIVLGTDDKYKLYVVLPILIQSSPGQWFCDNDMLVRVEKPKTLMHKPWGSNASCMMSSIKCLSWLH